MISSQALETLTTLLGPPRRNRTKYIAGWQLADGLEMALQLDQPVTRVWVGVEPATIDGVTVKQYDDRATRISGLDAHAPSLTFPRVAWRCTVSSSEALRALVEWYSALKLPTGSFATLTASFLEQFQIARQTPFRQVPELWATMEAAKARLEAFQSLKRRSYILVKWSLGKGGWANVPWIALLNRNVTLTAQQGLYIVFLVAEDLSRIYLTSKSRHHRHS